MSSAPWIQVDPSTEMTKRPGHELRFMLLMPPHEIPQAVRGDFDKQTNKFVIEVRYLDDEDFKRRIVDDIVCLRVGKRSRRLLGLELDTTKFNVTSVQLEIKALEQEIKRAVERLAEAESVSGERENYSLAMKAIESKSAQLFNPDLLASAH